MDIKPVAAIGLMAVGVGAAAAAVLGQGMLPSDVPLAYRTSEATMTSVQDTAAATGQLVAVSAYGLAFGEPPVSSSGATADAPATAGGGGTASSSGSSQASAINAGAGNASGADVMVRWQVSEVNVRVGDIVRAGDVLARADDRTAALAVQFAEANLAAAKVQRANDLKGGTPDSRADAKDRLTQAKQQLAQAQANYASTVAQGNLSLKHARQALADTKAQLARDEAAGVPQQALDQDARGVTQAQQDLESTALRVTASNRQASGQVASARLTVATATRGYKSATTSADDATIIADDVAIAEAEQALADAQAALAAATIRAPIDGRITVVNAVEGQESSGVAIELQSLRLATTVDVGEADILDLAVGQAASVVIGATGETVTGKVTAIDPVASSTGGSAVVTYAVTVTLDEAIDDGAATRAGSAAGSPGATPVTVSSQPAASAAAGPLPGMSAEVVVVTAQADNAVAIPSIALSGTSGNYTARVLLDDGTVEVRDVLVGLVTSELAQITSGIEIGETVVTGTSADRATSAESTNGAGGGDPLRELTGNPRRSNGRQQP
jgi:multidrug efflux pump subunit AcrA (membrane-fusion protein)